MSHHTLKAYLYIVVDTLKKSGDRRNFSRCSKNLPCRSVDYVINRNLISLRVSYQIRFNTYFLLTERLQNVKKKTVETPTLANKINKVVESPKENM